MQKIKTLKMLIDLLKAESEPSLIIPELSKVSRSELVELIDWELKRVAEAQKVFGVTGWSLLAGLAVVTWSFASMPNLIKANLDQVLWAFFLLESILISSETLWSFVLNQPASSISGRTIRFSTIGGAAARPSAAAHALRFFILLVTSFFLPTSISAGFLLAPRIVIVLMLLLMVGIIVLLACGIPFIPKKEKSKLGMTASIFTGLLKFTAIVGPAVVFPVLIWSWVITFRLLPNMEDFRLAGLLVAAGYLLRLLLISNAQSRNQPFLEQLRRDVALGFLSPEQGALKLAWRVSDLPQDIYIKGRIRALMEELTPIEANLRSGVEKLQNAAKTFQEFSVEKKSSEINSMAQWLENFLASDLASKAGHIVGFRAGAFLALARNQAKGTEEYLKLEAGINLLNHLAKNMPKPVLCVILYCNRLAPITRH